MIYPQLGQTSTAWGQKFHVGSYYVPDPSNPTGGRGNPSDISNVIGTTQMDRFIQTLIRNRSETISIENSGSNKGIYAANGIFGNGTYLRPITTTVPVSTLESFLLNKYAPGNSSAEIIKLNLISASDAPDSYTEANFINDRLYQLKVVIAAPQS